MGQVTIFTLLGCQFCEKAKAILQKHNVKYVDISLSDYPHKREGMTALCDKVTVPQIFFNDTYIGDYSALHALERQETLAATLEELRLSADPTDERLQRPSEPPVQEDVYRVPPEKPICFTGTAECSMGYTDVQEFLTAHLDVQDRSKGFLRGTERKCFTGKNFVDLMESKFQLSRLDALTTGRHLMENYNLFSACDDSTQMEDSSKTLYRLQIHSATALNMTRVLPALAASECHTKDIFAMVRGAHDILVKEVVNKHKKDGLVDYVACAKEKEYIKFQRAVAEFQNARLDCLTDAEKVAFFVNIYNTMVKHAFIELGIPESDLARYHFYDSVTYRIGGYDFSLNDIESGILRANRKAPYHLFRSFSRGDPRAKLALNEAEKRIHFTLNCGARSCPPVKLYTREGIEEELRVATEAFMEDRGNLRVDVEKKTLAVSQIFKWYSEDFGTTKEILFFLLKHARGEQLADLQKLEKTKFSVRYLPYDWNTDAATHIPYDKKRP